MNLGHAKAEGKLNKFALYAGTPLLVIGLVIDFIVQMTVATVLWLELPRELTVSARVERLCKSGHGYRLNIALWFRKTLLSPFDRTGGHG
jgi:hypothetical protein